MFKKLKKRIKMQILLGKATYNITLAWLYSREAQRCQVRDLHGSCYYYAILSNECIETSNKYIKEYEREEAS